MAVIDCLNIALLLWRLFYLLMNVLNTFSDVFFPPTHGFSIKATSHSNLLKCFSYFFVITLCFRYCLCLKLIFELIHGYFTEYFVLLCCVLQFLLVLQKVSKIFFWIIQTPSFEDSGIFKWRNLPWAWDGV